MQNLPDNPHNGLAIGSFFGLSVLLCAKLPIGDVTTCNFLFREDCCQFLFQFKRLNVNRQYDSILINQVV